MMNCAVTLKMVKYVVYYSSNNNNSNNKELVWRHNHCSLKYLFKNLLSPFLLICGFFVCVFNQLFFLCYRCEVTDNMEKTPPLSAVREHNLF